MKQAKNIFKKLITDSKIVFYAIEKINKPLFNKAKIYIILKIRFLLNCVMY